MKNITQKIILIFLLVFLSKLHSQEKNRGIDYIKKENIINFDESPKYEKTAIKEEFIFLMEAAKNNFPNDNLNDPGLMFRREASLLHSICFNKMKEYKSDILILYEKHKKLYLKEEKRNKDYLKSNSGIGQKIRLNPNYHKIYIYIESYIIPCLEKGTTKDFLYKNNGGDMFFLTNEELNNYLKKAI